MVLFPWKLQSWVMWNVSINLSEVLHLGCKSSLLLCPSDLDSPRQKWNKCFILIIRISNSKISDSLILENCLFMSKKMYHQRGLLWPSLVVGVTEENNASINFEGSSIRVCCSSLKNGWADFYFTLICTFSFSECALSLREHLWHLVWVLFLGDSSSLWTDHTCTNTFAVFLGWGLDLERCLVRVRGVTYSVLLCLIPGLTWIFVSGGRQSWRILWCQTSQNAVTLSGLNLLPFPCPRHTVGSLHGAL